MSKFIDLIGQTLGLTKSCGCLQKEVILRVGISNKGSSRTEESKMKMSISHKGKHLSEEHKNKILLNHANIPHYAQPNGSYKLAAGWLIEQCGWKGKRFDHYGVHEHQSLVLVNHGVAHGRDIYNLSERIIESVYDTFEIKLEREVNIL